MEEAVGVFKPFRSACVHPVRSVTSCSVSSPRSSKGASFSSCGGAESSRATPMLKATSLSQSGNPNPQNFVFGRVQVVGAHIVAELVYPDCTNYEGRKVLVYQGVNLRYLMAQQSLDPHFCNDKGHVHPFARFEPTEAGWVAAVRCAEGLG